MGRGDTDVSSIERPADGPAARPYHDNSSSNTSSEVFTVDDEEQAAPRRRGNTAPSGRWVRAVGRRIPRPVRRAASWIATWSKGPEPPRVWKIDPVYPNVQHLPLRLVDRIAPKRMQKFWLLVALYFVFLLCFITILNQSAFSEEVPGYGSPTTIGCTATYWSSKNGCGLNGDDCRPFENATLAFRCPANCITTQQLNPHAVGAQEVVYRPLVVGGPTDLRAGNVVSSAFYRGDSFICAAAIHSGFLSNAEGGCGVVSLVGRRSNFPAVSLHGIDSVAFDSDFPLAYQFVASSRSECRDLRWPLLGVSVTLTALLGLCSASPAVFFWSVFCGAFFHCALVSDPPTASDYYTLVSTAFGRFLPAAFTAFVIYITSVRRSLTGLTAQVEKVVLWLGACWVGVLNNYTFDKIPIQRLTAHDLKQQPGAITALVIILLVILVIALGQAWAIRVQGQFREYLALYCAMGLCLGLLAAIPGMSLRIHHYILALLLLPGTGLQTRPSLLYQGLLVGLFIDGTARWGFDSIVQTPGELLGDGQIGSDLPALVGPSIVNGTISFGWPAFPDGYDGLSVLVNDVERFRHYIYDGPANFTWSNDAPSGDPSYYRFGFMSGSSSQDYTKAGIWEADGTWTPPAEGPSKKS